MNIKKIAGLAGVSTATVSNVITGNHHKVSKKTIDKVNQIIAQYDYKPNAVARSLATKESKIIGIIIPNLIESERFTVNPNNAQLVSHLEKYIRSQNYFLMIRGVDKCREIIPLFSTWNMDGIIFLGAYKEEVKELSEKLKIPTMYVDTYAEDLPIANVGIDDYEASYRATCYLIDKGHRRIAFAGPNVESAGVIKERFSGYQKAMQKHKLMVDDDYVFGGLTLFEEGLDIGKQIALSPINFTAIVSMADILSFGIIESLQEAGKQVPADISLISFDNLPECRYSNPQLTTISQNLDKKALFAGDCLFKMIRGKKEIICNEKIDFQIIERGSVRVID